MWYQYQAFGSSGAVVTWSYPTPDPTGAHAGETVTDTCQLNDPPIDGSGTDVAWSGVGITGSQVPTNLVCGAGISGSFGSGTLTLTTTPTLQTVTGDGDPIFTAIGKIYFSGLTVTQIDTDTIHVSAAQAVMHAPVDACTCRNLASVTGGLELPTSSSDWIATYDGDQDNLANGTRVLVQCQTTASQNDVYTVDTANNRLVRSTEIFDVGHQIPVTNGRVWASTMWTYTATDTFTPPAGSPTYSVWAVVDPDTTVAWVPLLTVPGVDGVDAYQWHLHLDITGSLCEGETTTPIVRTFRTYGTYACNPSGDMTPFGNSDGTTGIAFGEFSELPNDYRLRAVVDGNALTIEGYQDATGGDNKPYRYRLEVTSRLRQVVY